MIAFFDTSVHVALLRGTITLDAVLAQVPAGPGRMSPIVAHELLRGSRDKARRVVDRVVRRLLPIEPPSWASSFLEAGRLLPAIFSSHEEVGLARLQNDVLLALTARHTGAAFVTSDRHFRSLREHVPFALISLETVPTP
jgi:predicted nucleic acid-binding protein